MPQGKLTIEFIELARNRTIREMFTNDEARKEIAYFVAEHLLHMRIITSGSGDHQGVELTGDDKRLNEFFRAFLVDDVTTGAFRFERTSHL